MAVYGYHISNLPRQEKFEEVEKYLDKKLKGWEKPNIVFEKDGTIRQRYIKKNDESNTNADNDTSSEENTNEENKDTTEVVLVKNITECNITVYSDIELKFLKFDGKLLLLRDVIPTVIFAAVQWILMRWVIFLACYGTLSRYIALSAALVFVTVIINFATVKLLHVRRNMLRVRLIQYGGIFTAFPFLYHISRLFARYSLTAVMGNLMVTPILVVSLAMLITCFLYSKMSKR